jgi:hypothetical protein
MELKERLIITAQNYNFDLTPAQQYSFNVYDEYILCFDLVGVKQKIRNIYTGKLQEANIDGIKNNYSENIFIERLKFLLSNLLIKTLSSAHDTERGNNRGYDCGSTSDSVAKTLENATKVDILHELQEES